MEMESMKNPMSEVLSIQHPLDFVSVKPASRFSIPIGPRSCNIPSCFKGRYLHPELDRLFFTRSKLYHSYNIAMHRLNLLTLLAVFIPACLGNQEVIKYEPEPAAEPTPFSRPPVSVHHTKSLVLCAILCSTRRNCLTFRYQRANGECQLSSEEPGNFGSGAVAFSAKRRLQRTGLSSCRYLQATDDGRRCCPIQQRLTGDLNFQRLWDDYVMGFGDGKDFWIGLETIHELSHLAQVSTDTQQQNKAGNFLMDLQTMSGEILHQEYFGFMVEDSETNYTLLLGQVDKDKSDFPVNVFNMNNASQFSTMDRDNDVFPISCSTYYHGSAGWWFSECSYVNPNGIYSGNASFLSTYMYWRYNSTLVNCRAIRLMLTV